jgi:hypothetical protein
VENILAKLKQIQENPGYFKGLTPEEQAELFVYLLEKKKPSQSLLAKDESGGIIDSFMKLFK